MAPYVLWIWNSYPACHSSAPRIAMAWLIFFFLCFVSFGKTRWHGNRWCYRKWFVCCFCFCFCFCCVVVDIVIAWLFFLLSFGWLVVWARVFLSFYSWEIVTAVDDIFSNFMVDIWISLWCWCFSVIHLVFFKEGYLTRKIMWTFVV